ncbi:fatty acyl-CoA hydrolase precursor, medium chain-like [Ptychodera flava]|uniref:fatty acyl-CoA hydrolase precursor, medium chain-like n=1 Tax=Ptychodera flava TaxID=63121 RepID=UPI003969C712
MHSLSLGPSLIVCLVASLSLCSSAEDPIVEVSSGRLAGKAVDFSHKDVNVTRTVHVFKGIPFVEPPVGDLRFRQPQAKQPWEEVYDATEYGPICIQPQNPTFPVRGTQSEDCLFLNVFSPETDTTAKLPVMVWIHGGGLSGGSGSGDYHDGTALAAIGDVIVVSFNYRLGVLGFFATGDSHAAGNYGFYDQIAALQWVQTNIAAFGGDPGKVTVFGESAGSTSIEYLLLSPLTDGLFHRAIMQSGTATMEWFVARPCGDVCKKVAHGLGKLVGCEKSTSEELVNCLRTVSAEDFRDPVDPMKGQIPEVTGLGEDELTTIAFPPYIDGHFLKEKPEDVIRDKTFPKKDINLIIGTMASEGHCIYRC